MSAAGSPTPAPAALVATPAVAKRIVLLALDHSNHSAYAFDWAKQNLLSPVTDHVVLVHVRPIAVGPSALYEDAATAARDAEEDHRLSSHKLLQHYGYDLKKAHFTVRAISIRGDTRSDIVRKAQELNATLVVCGSRGLGTLQRAFLGSVSNYITNHCPCPVLVIRPPADSALVKQNLGAQRAPVSETPETAQVAVDQEAAAAAAAAAANEVAEPTDSAAAIMDAEAKGVLDALPAEATEAEAEEKAPHPEASA
ncbi:hypothetical protein GGF32_006278 [Allomyces javanicus]|nr:hypothetical protein GGF32_006278 [Allomyces javanicus]